MTSIAHTLSPDAAVAAARDAWLTRQDDLAARVRAMVLAEQLDVHAPLAPATVLDVGAGTGAVAIELARRGYSVTAVEPDDVVRARLEASLAREKPAVRGRVTVLDESLETLDEVFSMTDLFDVVCCHGVLPSLVDPNPAIRALGRRLAEDGILSVVSDNAGAVAWADALDGRPEQALAALDLADRSRRARVDPVVDRDGVAMRADSVERLGAFFGGSRVAVESWYGVQVVAPSYPADADVAGLARLEVQLGRTEPYKRLGTEVHVVGRRGQGRGPQLTF